MVYKYNSKKGQAAIEFLMTYGWMLLVVLIVGALIFSFVDFGSLLPNKVELSNSLRASAVESYASRGDDATGSDSHVVLVFTYNGAKQIIINDTIDKNKIVSSVNPSEECDLVWVKNVDTDSATDTSAPASGLTAANAISNVIFLNGQTGIVEFNCSNLNGNSGLYVNDAIEGQVTILTVNAKTGVQTPSTGPLRFSVNE